MKSIELKGTIREAVGKKSSKNDRLAANVPCVMYGGKETVYFAVVARDLKDVIFTPKVYLVDLEISGKKYQAKIQDLQVHPVSDDILHIDFYEVAPDKLISIELPVRVEGSSIGVKEGGKLVQDKRLLKIRGVVKSLPDEILVDISPLAIGDTIRVADLKGAGYDFLDAKSCPVVSIKMTRAARGAAAEAANAANTGKKK